MTAYKEADSGKILKQISRTLVVLGGIAIVADLLLTVAGNTMQIYKYAIAGMALAYILHEIGEKCRIFAEENQEAKKDATVELAAKLLIALAVAIGNFLI